MPNTHVHGTAFARRTQAQCATMFPLSTLKVTLTPSQVAPVGGAKVPWLGLNWQSSYTPGAQRDLALRPVQQVEPTPLSPHEDEQSIDLKTKAGTFYLAFACCASAHGVSSSWRGLHDRAPCQHTETTGNLQTA